MRGIYFKFNLSNIGYRIIRIESSLFDITDCRQFLDGHIDECNALLKDAKEMQPHFVAGLVAESKARDQQLQDVEKSLRERIDLRHSRTRNAKRRLRLQEEIVK